MKEKIEALWQKILELADMEDFEQVPIGKRCRWFSGEKMHVFEAGEPIPFNTDLVAFAMFQDDAEVRVYAVFPPHRLTVSKAAPTMFVEEMTLDVFALEVAEELASMLPEEAEEPNEPVSPDGGIGATIARDG